MKKVSRNNSTDHDLVDSVLDSLVNEIVMEEKKTPRYMSEKKRSNGAPANETGLYEEPAALVGKGVGGLILASSRPGHLHPVTASLMAGDPELAHSTSHAANARSYLGGVGLSRAGPGPATKQAGGRRWLNMERDLAAPDFSRAPSQHASPSLASDVRASRGFDLRASRDGSEMGAYELPAHMSTEDGEALRAEWERERIWRRENTERERRQVMDSVARADALRKRLEEEAEIRRQHSEEILKMRREASERHLQQQRDAAAARKAARAALQSEFELKLEEKPLFVEIKERFHVKAAGDHEAYRQALADRRTKLSVGSTPAREELASRAKHHDDVEIEARMRLRSKHEAGKLRRPPEILDDKEMEARAAAAQRAKSFYKSGNFLSRAQSADAERVAAEAKREDDRRERHAQRKEYGKLVKETFLPKIKTDETKRSQILSRINATAERPLSMSRASSARRVPVNIHELFADKKVIRDGAYDAPVSNSWETGSARGAASYRGPPGAAVVAKAPSSARRVASARGGMANLRLPQIGGGSRAYEPDGEGYRPEDVATEKQIRQKLAQLGADY